MADAGLQIWNSDGFLQIDGAFSNYAMIQKGTIQLNNANVDWDDHPSQPPALIIVPNGKNPLLALKPKSNMRIQRWKTGTTWYFKLLRDGDIWNPEGIPAVPYYVFDEAPTEPTQHGYGLQVWNEQGQIVFDSMFNYMRIIDVINQYGVFAYVGWSMTPYTYSGKEIAVVTCQQGYKVEQDGGSPAGQALSLKTLSPVIRPNQPDTVQMYDGAGIYLDGAYASNWTQPLTTVLVIDVSGM